MDPTLFELAPQEFEGVIAELGLPQSEADQLRRQYRRQNSMFAGLYGLLDSVAGRDAEQGRVRADVLPMTRPEGMTGIEALLSGNAELAIPGGLLGGAEAAVMGIDAPAAAYQGMIPAEDMAGEALGTAGMAMTGGGAAARPTGSVGMGGRVVAASESRAQRIARMLREGRGDEITDDMLAALDANDNMELAQLYAAGETGVDMPMDFESRMARAAEMGFDLTNLLTHGSKRDFYGFSSIAPRSTDFGWYGQGVSLAPNNPSISDAYAMVEKEGVGRWGGRTYPVTTRGRIYEWPEYNPPATSLEQSQEVTQSLRDLGYEGANSYAPNDPDVWGDAAGSWREQTIYNPTNIRSSFARFDPRLRNSANLLAANASPELGLLAASAPSEEDQLDQLRAYLGLLNQ
jgi:hypothetical protein